LTPTWDWASSDSTIVFPDRGRVRGRVLDEQGRSLAGVSVVLVKDEGSPYEWEGNTHSDDLGEFLLEGFPGSYTVGVFRFRTDREDRRVVSLKPVVVEPNGEVVVELRLPRD
jgi:hypothetical protein